VESADFEEALDFEPDLVLAAGAEVELGFGAWDASGRRMVKVDPLPCYDQTRTSPPWFCTACLTMASPSPVPPV